MSPELDTKTTARVVESLVLRGDISALSPAERAKYYVQMCESLGLTAATQPFAILRLNGKEILYPTRGATDQLAAIHKLNREIIDGPKVIDVAGTKMIYAMCRATHPNGRSETAVATVPVSDPLNALMKAETKAKRRATLSILGLGMLDESELDTIPERARVEVAPPAVAEINAVQAAPAELPAQTARPLGHLLGDLFEAQNLEELVELLREARASQLPQSDRARVWRDAVDRARVLGLTPEQLRSAL